jgi:exopolyphosphatase
LEAKKVNVSNLGVWDLLRRDFKEYTLKLPWVGPDVSIKAGLSTVPLGLEGWTNGRLEAEAKKWMETKGLAVHGILTSYRDTKKLGKSGRGKHRRQQLWIVREVTQAGDGDGDPHVLVSLDALTNKLFKGLEADKQLKLKRNKSFDIDKKGALPAGMKARVYDQKNVDASRKVIAPALKRILEEDAQVSTVEGADGKRATHVRRLSTNVLSLFRKRE